MGEAIELIEMDRDGHVTTLTLTAPPVNALSWTLKQGLIRAIEELSRDDQTRVIILTGAGKVFCAGADFTERAALADGSMDKTRHNSLVRECFDVVADCPKPVIAAINGAATGGGCVLALCCDIIVTAEDAFVSLPESTLGLAGGVSHVRRVLSPSDARLMVYTGMRIGGQDMLRKNIASLCVPGAELLSATMAVAQDIARKPPLAIEAAKRSFHMTSDLSVSEGYRYEQTQTEKLMTSEDTSEAMAAIREKRSSIFQRK